MLGNPSSAAAAQYLGRIERSLAVAVRSRRNHRWRLLSDAWRDCIPPLDDYLARGARTASPESQDVVVLKRCENRDIIRLHLPSASPVAPPSVVVKSFPLASWRKRLLRWHRYGPAEAAHLLEARARQLPVPEVYMYGEIRCWIMVMRTIVVMEDLADCLPLHRLLERCRGDEATEAEIMDRVGQLTLRLYHAGCNHIDLHAQNIFFSNNDGSQLRLIDLQYARFYEQPHLEALLFNLGYLAHTLEARLGLPCLERWARKTLEQAGVDGGCTDARLARFHYYRNANLSRHDRLLL
jgi:tRNA A-37 threonylcarbamoyl transferase component Bud32